MKKGRTENLWHRIEPLLHKVEKPSRYLGCEWNTFSKRNFDLRVVLAYPDLYEIGVCNLGLLILQEITNDLEGVLCERVYSPGRDMEDEMRKEGIQLFSLETHLPVGTADIFGIAIPHELTYSNILNLLDLAGIPLRSSDRKAGPIVVGGGYGAVNPEPIADFFDLIVIGEGERCFRDLVTLVVECKRQGLARADILERASTLRGVYRPSDFDIEYHSDGRIRKVINVRGGPKRIVKCAVDLDLYPYPKAPVVPFCEAVHDRLNVEIFRGCTRGCRFCQAGMVYRPLRERSLDAVKGLIDNGLRITGYDEVSLCSLSSTDYSLIDQAVEDVRSLVSGRNVNVSLPSLRMDAFSVETASSLGTGGGLTFAPEAATDRLRRVINKPIPEADMVEALVKAVRAGKRRIKLYFMIGLPTETEEDVREIPRLVYRLRDAVRSEGLPPPSINVSISSFVPKAHTPFQWCPQERVDEIERKQNMLKSSLRSRSVNLSWHDRYMSRLEGVFSRGDRRLSPVVESAWRKGARFDSWSESFDFRIWEEACVESGVDPDFYLYRERKEDETFPWDHIDFGISKRFLRDEYEKAMRAEPTYDCREGTCSGCGVCEALGMENLLRR